MKKIVSLIMAIVMLLSLGNGVFADQIALNEYSEKYDDIELLREVISNMNEYEKSLFIKMIQSSVEEQEFYRDNIDRNYIINYNVNDKNSYHDINNSSIPSNNLKMQAQSFSIALKEFNVGIEALE